MKINSDGSAFADNDTRIPFLGCLVLKETRTDPESNKSNTNFSFLQYLTKIRKLIW